MKGGDLVHLDPLPARVEIAEIDLGLRVAGPGFLGEQAIGGCDVTPVVGVHAGEGVARLRERGPCRNEKRNARDRPPEGHAARKVQPTAQPTDHRSPNRPVALLIHKHLGLSAFDKHEAKRSFNSPQSRRSAAQSL